MANRSQQTFVQYSGRVVSFSYMAASGSVAFDEARPDLRFHVSSFCTRIRRDPQVGESVLVFFSPDSQGVEQLIEVRRLHNASEP